MPGSDEFVVHEFFRSSQMAGEATLAALYQIAHIQHAEFLDRALVRPIFDSVLTKPPGGWTVATLATHAVANIEGLGPLLRRDGECVTCQATRSLIRRTLQLQNLADANRDRIGKHLVGAGMFILAGPDAVFILRDACDRFRLDAAVATAGGAPASAIELPHHRIGSLGTDGACQKSQSQAESGP